MVRGMTGEEAKFILADVDLNVVQFDCDVDVLGTRHHTCRMAAKLRGY